MKGYFLIIAALAAVFLCACSGSTAVSTINVNVQDSRGLILENAPVYMFVDSRPSRLEPPGNARVSRVTDDNGMASFFLDIKEMKINSSRSPIYFAVYYEVDDKMYMASHNAIRLRGGEEEIITVVLPISL